MLISLICFIGLIDFLLLLRMFLSYFAMSFHVIQLLSFMDFLNDILLDVAFKSRKMIDYVYCLYNVCLSTLSF